MIIEDEEDTGGLDDYEIAQQKKRMNERK